MLKEVFITSFPRQSRMGPTRCSHCMCHVLLPQKLSRCVIAHIPTHGSSWLASRAVNSLRAGFLWFPHCSSVGAWRLRHTHRVCEKYSHSFLFLTAMDSKTEVSHGQSEHVSLPLVCPCGGAAFGVGKGVHAQGIRASPLTLQ